jgi:Uma2 family endonuclease
MTAALQRRMTAEEFLKWADNQTEGRFELVDGQIVAMAPERLAHTRTKSAVWLALRTAIRELGLPCEAVADGPAVVTGPYKTRGPDASVQCGPADEPNSLALDRPLIVVEVISPTSEQDDRRTKFAEYFSVATIRHYLIVDGDQRTVLHHRRSEDGSIGTKTLRDGWIDLDPPGFNVAVEDLFQH